MQPPTINPLFGMQPTATAPKAQPASGSAFGEMLSRELGNRQVASAAPAAQPPQVPQARQARPAQPAPPSAEPARTPSRPSQPAQSSAADGAGATSARARQDSQRAQDRRDSNAQADATDGARSTADADSGNRAATAGSASTDQRTDKSKTNDKTAADDDAAAAQAASDTAGTAATSTAAAALLALVTSMAPRAAVAPSTGTAPAATDATADPKLAAQKGAALLPGGAHDAAADDASQSDPAFDALLSQAAQATAARDAARSGGAGPGAEGSAARGLPQAGAGTPGSAAVVPNELAGKAEPALKPSVAQAAFVLDAAKAPDGAALSANVAIGTTAMAGMTSVTQAGGQGDGNTLAPRVGTPAWDNALGQKVVWMAAGAEQSASLTLNPPDLGPLQVVINVSNTHAEATFTAAQPEVRQALEAAMPKLKEMLAEAGISLGQTSVGAGSPDQSGAQAQQQAQQARRAGGRDTADGTLAAPVRSTRIVTGGNGLVDTFA